MFMWGENKLFLHWSFDSFIFSTATNESLTVHDTSGGEKIFPCVRYYLSYRFSFQP